jgi:hypothetical protein
MIVLHRATPVLPWDFDATQAIIHAIMSLVPGAKLGPYVGLPEINAALCLNEEVVNDLKKRRGFTPVAFLEPLPS